jgi:DNA adenine methylase
LEISEIIETKRIYKSPFKIVSSDFFENSINPLLSELNVSLKDKVKRIKNIEEKENIKFSIEELREHIETAFQSTLYFYCRKIYNNEIKKDTDLPWYIAHWLFVREFCYSSMFRFSKSGKFNVPYGGISYNKKDLSNKIERLLDSKLITLLENTDINNLDFEDLFKKYKYFHKDDFMFLDPPYDTEFSQYNKEKDFDKEEQIRLRDSLLKVNCKIMIVIKETDFILSLYEKDFNIQKFDKKYATNMRNRNNQEVVHLIITNY